MTTYFLLGLLLQMSGLILGVLGVVCLASPNTFLKFNTILSRTLVLTEKISTSFRVIMGLGLLWLAYFLLTFPRFAGGWRDMTTYFFLGLLMQMSGAILGVLGVVCLASPDTFVKFNKILSLTIVIPDKISMKFRAAMGLGLLWVAYFLLMFPRYLR